MSINLHKYKYIDWCVMEHGYESHILPPDVDFIQKIVLSLFLLVPTDITSGLYSWNIGSKRIRCTSEQIHEWWITVSLLVFSNRWSFFEILLEQNIKSSFDRDHSDSLDKSCVVTHECLNPYLVSKGQKVSVLERCCNKWGDRLFSVEDESISQVFTFVTDRHRGLPLLSYL